MMMSSGETKWQAMTNPGDAPTAPGVSEVADALDALVEEALIESFPASDPPCWMPIGRSEPPLVESGAHARQPAPHHE
ncbi:MAG TPA: hypothetical protein GX406_07195 [Pseudoclavibacter sp.]|nr:hypothetical protein [Pseudoclavibacter sp.]